MTVGRTASSIAAIRGVGALAFSPAPCMSSAPSAPSWPLPARCPAPYVAVTSMTWRSAREPSRIAPCHALTAAMAGRLEHRPSSIVRRPASIRFASATSPSRVRSGTADRSRRYMPIGSSGRSGTSMLCPAAVGEPSGGGPTLSSAAMPCPNGTTTASPMPSVRALVLRRSLLKGAQLGRQRIRIRHGPEGATPGGHRASACRCERPRREVCPRRCCPR